MLTKTKIKQSFAAASSSYDSVALLQRTVGESLLQRVEAINQGEIIVDLGCGTGFLTGGLNKQFNGQPERIIAIDIAMPMLNTAQHKLGDKPNVVYLCADAEKLPFQTESIGIVLSNLAFQWCNNLEDTLSDIKRVLQPNGKLLFTTFGVQTLHELKSAWREVDDYAHVNTFYDEDQIKNFLQQAGFRHVYVEKQIYTSTYESVWELMAELKKLGARTILAGCNKQLTSRSAMQRMICAYQKHNASGCIPATFEVITAIAKV